MTITMTRPEETKARPEVRTRFEAQIDMINIEGLTDTGNDGYVVQVGFDHVPSAEELKDTVKKEFKAKIGIAPYDDAFKGERAVAYVNMVEPRQDELGFLSDVTDDDIVV